MGATPKHNDIVSHERKPPQPDRLNAEASASRELSRSTLPNSSIVEQDVADLARSGALLIVFFQLIYAAEHRYTSASSFDATLSLHLANIAIGVVFVLLTFSTAMPRYWREIATFVCTAVMVSTTAIGVESMRIEPLFVTVLVMLIGAGMLAPWGWRWQGLISAVGMICFYALSHAHAVVDSDPIMHWLTLMTAIGLAHSNVYLQTKNRRELAQNLEGRRSIERKLKESEEKFRQIFEQSGDMVVVSNLDTGAILEVNDQFVKRSRVPRELVVGRSDLDFNFFAAPGIREHFMKELRETGAVQNLEAQLTGVDRAQPTTALISAVVVRLNNQNCVINVVHEISDIKEAERKLRNSEATLRKIFDANLDAMATSDPITRRYTDVNQ